MTPQGTPTLPYRVAELYPTTQQAEARYLTLQHRLQRLSEHKDTHAFICCYRLRHPLGSIVALIADREPPLPLLAPSVRGARPAILPPSIWQQLAQDALLYFTQTRARGLPYAAIAYGPQHPGPTFVASEDSAPTAPPPEPPEQQPPPDEQHPRETP